MTQKRWQGSKISPRKLTIRRPLSYPGAVIGSSEAGITAFAYEETLACLSIQPQTVLSLCKSNNKEIDMNWDAMGAVGEIVGAIAVLATLIYLAAQIRQNAQALDRQGDIAQAQIQQMRADSVTQLSTVCTANTENIELLTRLINTKEISPEELSPEENMRARMLLTMLRSNLENTFLQFKRGFLSEEFYLEVGVKNNLVVAQLILDFELPLTQSFREELLKNLSEMEAPPNA